jgi:hypothetical protein
VKRRSGEVVETTSWLRYNGVTMNEILFAVIVFANLYMVSIAELGDRLGMAILLILAYLAILIEQCLTRAKASRCKTENQTVLSERAELEESTEGHERAVPMEGTVLEERAAALSERTVCHERAVTPERTVQSERAESQERDRTGRASRGIRENRLPGASRRY